MPHCGGEGRMWNGVHSFLCLSGLWWMNGRIGIQRTVNFGLQYRMAKQIYPVADELCNELYHSSPSRFIMDN